MTFKLFFTHQSLIYTLCRLYPDSKIMGGSKTIKNTVGLKASRFCKKDIVSQYMCVCTKSFNLHDCISNLYMEV